jgi:hypothetical protein
MFGIVAAEFNRKKDVIYEHFQMKNVWLRILTYKINDGMTIFFQNDKRWDSCLFWKEISVIGTLNIKVLAKP